MNALRLVEPALRRFARSTLAPRFGELAAEAILDAAFDFYDYERKCLPEQPSMGGTLMIHCAALTRGLYQTLRDREVSEDEARSLTAGVTACIYGRMAALPTVLSKLGRPDARDRVLRATDLFRAFPFSAPSYEMVDVVAGEDLVAFDVRHCPVAAYFRSHGLGELCVESWCNLDFALARRWGARLERTTTIAGGADLCDFRWRVAPAEAQRS